MFLFFMVVLGVIVWFGNLIGQWKTEKRNKEMAIRDGRNFYSDRNGVKRYVDSDVPFRYSQGYTYSKDLGYHHEDLVVRHGYNGQVMRNISQERRDRKEVLRQEWKSEAIRNGWLLYRYDIPKEKSICIHEYEGYKKGDLPNARCLWKSLENGKIYALYRMKYATALFDIEAKQYTHLLNYEDLTAEQIEHEENEIKKKNEFLKMLPGDYKSEKEYNWQWNYTHDSDLNAENEERTRVFDYIIKGER